jgi:NDP-sugar pyrophosphorylase family protein
MLPIAILNGGLGARLGTITIDRPKCLVEINGKAFLEWQIQLLKEAGYTDFVFCISYKFEKVQEFLKQRNDFGVNIVYSIDGDKQLGTGGAVKKALHHLGSKFAVIYGDSYLPINYSKVEKNFLDSKDIACMTIYKNNNQFDRSNVEFKAGRIQRYSKNIQSDHMFYIDYGLTYLHSETFEGFKPNQAFDLSELLENLSISDSLAGFEADNRFYEIGSYEGILDLSNYLLRKNL